MPPSAPPSQNSPSPSTPDGTLIGATEGGVAGDHPPLTTRELLVGPTTQAEFNTVKAGLIPIGCWRVNDLRFHFGSSFVAPGIREELQTLKELIEKHTVGEKKPPLSIFGHADPVGEDEFNKGLSGRRAQAIYGLLTRNTDLWEELYSNPHGEDRWGDPEIDTMLDTVSSSGSDQPPTAEGEEPANRQARIEAFQAEHGLEVDGHVGVNTRRELFRAYMDTLCGDLVVAPTEFLGQGQDPDGKADYQGCSEFNPLLIFSQEEQERFQQAPDKTERNTENAPNRRVMVLLFRPGTEVTPERWPCPRVKENSSGCRKRFWSDGEDRRSRREPASRREFETTQDTFACRFYDRLSTNSPCERLLAVLPIRIVPEVWTRHGNVMAFAERLDGQPFPEVTKLIVGNIQIEFAFSAPDGRLYFLPRVDGTQDMVLGALPEIGTVLAINPPVQYAAATKEITESLRRQMFALRRCGEQAAEFHRQDGRTQAEIISIYNLIIGDGHLRLQDALEGIQPAILHTLGLVETSATLTDDEPIDDFFESLEKEHAPEIDQFLAMNSP